MGFVEPVDGDEKCRKGFARPGGRRHKRVPSSLNVGPRRPLWSRGSVGEAVGEPCPNRRVEVLHAGVVEQAGRGRFCRRGWLGGRSRVRCSVSDGHGATLRTHCDSELALGKPDCPEERRDRLVTCSGRSERKNRTIIYFGRGVPLFDRSTWRLLEKGPSSGSYEVVPYFGHAACSDGRCSACHVGTGIGPKPIHPSGSSR